MRNYLANPSDRTRGLVSGVFANRQRPTPPLNANEVLGELRTSFEDFQERQAAWQRDIEASIDSVNSLVAGARAGIGSGDLSMGSSPAEVRAAFEAFNSFTRSGSAQSIEAMREMVVRAGMSTDNDSDGGGYTIPREIGSSIVARQLNMSPMRQLATVIPISSSVHTELLDVSGNMSGWVGERQERPETKGLVLKALNYPAMEVYSNPALTQKLIDDNAVNVVEYLSNRIAKDFELQEGAAWAIGDGLNKPRGITQYKTVLVANDPGDNTAIGYVATGVAADLDDGTHNGGDALIDLMYSLNAGYRKNGTWMMNSATAGKVRKFKDDQGRYLWQQGLAAGQPSIMLGYPVAIDENMPDVGANQFPIAFGDFRSGYLIVDRMGVRILRDPYTNKPYVHFYTTKRVGGGVLDMKAIKLLKCEA